MDAVREQIGADLEELGVPGVSWVVVKGGEIASTGVAGVLGADRPVEATSLFQAASISKPIAVVAMLRLVDRGVLELDADVNRQLKSWQVPPTRGWQPAVTLRQLASHSGGLSVPGFPGYRPGSPLPTTVQILEGTPPSNTAGPRADRIPGMQFAYSGGGTSIIQLLLEDVTGRPFRELMRELVLEPMGMLDSDYAQPLPAELESRAALAHDELGRPIDGGWHVYPELAAAGLWTTSADLARFAIGVRRAYAGVDGALLSPELARELLRPQIAVEGPMAGLSHAGLGVFVTADGRLFGHSGGNAGYRCNLVLDRESGDGLAVMTNSDNGGHLSMRASAAAGAAFGWVDYEPLDWQVAVPTAEALEALAGDYVLDGGLRLAAVPQGNSLLVTFDGQPPLRFVALSATEFMPTATDARLEIRDGALVFLQSGVERACHRE
ncbi:beta-lactamase family protein [Kribbella sandramycini]|uniref:Beta-lactamase family protein n=1 Tax=Kribbella sandramycini TaxID=60450 RepID=A0A7Y4L3H3_9ACTN|nr:CubicO group peptidase (beta-lactamase class C family) [Kribbella sandramycini]NOL43634.1 beta-lactamase family protein [Kribbella sandramycini]